MNQNLPQKIGSSRLVSFLRGCDVVTNQALEIQIGNHWHVHALHGNEGTYWNISGTFRGALLTHRLFYRSSGLIEMCADSWMGTTCNGLSPDDG